MNNITLYILEKRALFGTYNGEIVPGSTVTKGLVNGASALGDGFKSLARKGAKGGAVLGGVVLANSIYNRINNSQFDRSSSPILSKIFKQRAGYFSPEKLTTFRNNSVS